MSPRRLFETPRRFSFFQAVRLLERGASRARDGTQRSLIGLGTDPRQEAVRFRGNLSLAFPATEISDAVAPEGGRPAVLTVSFMGLAGAMGVLPPYYAMEAVRMVRAKSTALRDFLDIFNHRLIALFYGAWAKYRVPIAYERCEADGEDDATQILRALIGIGAPGARDRIPGVPDELLIHFAGVFSRRSRSAADLGQLLSHSLNRPVRVEQFVGRWLDVSIDEQTTLSGSPYARGGFGRLGVDAMVGSRTWNIENGFRLEVGPLTYAEFERFLPGGDDLRRLVNLARFHAGAEKQFDVRPILKGEEVPGIRLQSDEGARLMHDTWLLPRRDQSRGDVLIG